MISGNSHLPKRSNPGTKLAESALTYCPLNRGISNQIKPVIVEELFVRLADKKAIL